MADELPTPVPPVTPTSSPAHVAMKVDENSQKIADKVESIKSIFTTPTGWVGAGGVVLGLIAAITPYIAGEKKIGNLFDGQVLHIVVDSMPAINGAVVKPAPLPLPAPQKTVRVVTFSKDGAPAGPWADFTAKGYSVTHYKDTDAKATEWSALIASAGGVPCVLLVDDKNYYGGGPIADAAKLVAKFGGDK